MNRFSIPAKAFANIALSAACLFGLAMTLPQSASAQLRTEESFPQTPPSNNSDADNMDGETSGFGWANSWTRDVPFNQDFSKTISRNGSLSFGSLATSGNTLEAGNRSRLWRTVDTSSYNSLDGSSNLGADGTSVYTSVLIQSENSSDDFFAMRLTRGNPAGASPGRAVRIGGNNGNLEAVAEPASGIASSPGSSGTFQSDDGNTHFYVARFDFASGGDTVSLYFDPSLSSEPSSADVTLGGSSSGADFSFDNVSLEAFDDSGSSLSSFRALYDEVRLGETYGDVTAVPEPATFALAVGLAGLGAVLLRRRKS